MRLVWIVLAAVLLVLAGGCAGNGIASAPTLTPTPPDNACAPGERDPLCRADAADEETARVEYPEATAAAWVGGALWTANESGRLTRWNVQDGSYTAYETPDGSIVRSIVGLGDALAGGADGGAVWILAADRWRSHQACQSSAVASLAADERGGLWCACPGEGLVEILAEDGSGSRRLIPSPDHARDSLAGISAVAYASETGVVWVGCQDGTLLSYDSRDGRWTDHVTPRGGSAVRSLLVGADGSVWLATSAGIRVYRHGTVLACSADPQSPDAPALAIDRAADGTVWVTSEDRVAQVSRCDAPRVYTDADNPVLVDRHRLVVLDEAGWPWFIGRRGKVRFDGVTWTAIDADVRRQVTFTPVEPRVEVVPPPLVFPSPSESYAAWLGTWPRPADDNGRGLHFLQTHEYDAIEAQRQVNRLRALGMRWTTVLYRDHAQLVRTAPIFQAAGIVAVWRPFVRPYETYSTWAEDVAYLRSRGIAPYMQLYNEPSLEQEWEGGLVPPNQDVYLDHLVAAVREVYEAGGYVGLQSLNPDWLRAALQAIKASDMDYVLDRTFFVPHLHGLNHPPDYAEDIHGVLGFREYARIFEEEIGFVPAMIVGEGGWRLGEQQDDRFPAISEELHRDYHMVVFDWFRRRRLSDGTPLPDYLLAFCAWLVSDPNDPAAWFDSTAGDRRLTIEAVIGMGHQE